MGLQDPVDAVDVMDAGVETGREHHVLQDGRRQGEPGGLQEVVRLVAGKGQREGERHRRPLRDGPQLIADDGRVGLAIDPRGVVDARGVAVVAVAHVFDQLRGKRRIRPMQIRHSPPRTVGGRFRLILCAHCHTPPLFYLYLLLMSLQSPTPTPTALQNALIVFPFYSATLANARKLSHIQMDARSNWISTDILSSHHIAPVVKGVDKLR